MKKGWTTTKLIAAGSVGVAMLILSLAGGVLNSVTGIAGVGGLINVFVQGGLTTFVVLTVRQSGSATVAWLVLTILAIPLPIIGPAGFFFKILNGLFIGICSDFTSWVFRKRERVAGVLVGGASTASAAVALFALSLFGIKWLLVAEKVSRSLLTFPGVIVFVLLSFIAGMVPGYLGWLIYDRLKDTSVIKRIQA